MFKRQCFTGYQKIHFAITLTLCLTCSSCIRTKLPARNFSTSQLLISSLPGWGIYEGPNEVPHDVYLDEAIEEVEIRFMRPPAGIEQWSRTDVDNGLWDPVSDMNQTIAKYTNSGYARQAYSNHWIWLNNKPKPFKGFDYISKLADQFRIDCDVPIAQPPEYKEVTICYIEGQYDEFYTYVVYGTFNRSNTIDDLKAISTAMDEKMSEFLGSNK